MRDGSGSDILCATLEELGVEHVFGVPGTQNVHLFESLRRSRLRTVVPTSELAASFMANGYFRGSGRVGVLTTIPGPGFTYALSGIAEARLDSAAVLHIAGRPADGPGLAYQLQRIEQRAVAAPIYKRIHEAKDAGELRPVLAEAHAHALAGEPGPVLVEVAAAAMTERASASPLSPPPVPVEPDAQDVEEIIRRLLAASRPLLYAGQGANAAAAELADLAALLRAPVVTTTSGRGVLPEDHALCIPLDLGRPASAILNALVETSDLVLILGCKMSHNGAHGFRLRIPPEKLIHLDASAETLGANYPASRMVRCDVPKLLSSLLRQRDRLETRAARWQPEEIEAARARSREALASIGPEPRVPCVDPSTPASFFALLRKHLPRESCLTTDSGMHQVLARRHFPVLAPRGFLVPSDFQSMGFGLAAAIGAKLACPGRTVVALVGDGGLVMSGSEILTAVREALPLTVIVFNDGHLGLIRAQQLDAHGHAHGTRLQSPDWEMFAGAVGAEFARLDRDAEQALPALLKSPGVTLIEVPIGDSPSARGVYVRRRAAGAVKRRLRKAAVWARTRYVRQDERALRRRFNRLADEARFGEQMDRDHAWFTARLLDQMRPGPGDSVLEIACGDGWACRMGAGRAPEAAFVGFDISDVMLRQARSGGGAAPSVSLLQASADTLPFRAEAFTAAFCVESFFLFPNLERASREMQRVLAPGGAAFLVQCLFKENRGALAWIDHLQVRVHVRSATEYRRLLEETGWTDVRTLELRRSDAAGRRPDPHDHALLVVARKPGSPRTPSGE